MNPLHLTLHIYLLKVFQIYYQFPSFVKILTLSIPGAKIFPLMKYCLRKVLTINYTGRSLHSINTTRIPFNVKSLNDIKPVKKYSFVYQDCAFFSLVCCFFKTSIKTAKTLNLFLIHWFSFFVIYRIHFCNLTVGSNIYTVGAFNLTVNPINLTVAGDFSTVRSILIPLGFHLIIVEHN